MIYLDVFHTIQCEGAEASWKLFIFYRSYSKNSLEEMDGGENQTEGKTGHLL